MVLYGKSVLFSLNEREVKGRKNRKENRITKAKRNRRITERKRRGKLEKEEGIKVGNGECKEVREERRKFKIKG